MRRLRVLLAVVIAGVAALWVAGPASAQAPEVIATDFRQPDWPATVSVSALARGDIAEATLLYRVLPEGAITRLGAEIASGDAVRLEAEIPTARADGRIWIPAGSRFEWQWQLIDSEGVEHLTEPELWAYEDPRYEWREVRRGKVIVHFYDPAEELATVLAGAGNESLTSGEALLGVELEFPIHVYVWLGSEDAAGVDRPRPESYEEAVVTGGQRVLADLIHVFTPTRWVVRHEVRHVLTKVAGEGGIGSLPAWLDEGTATISEGDWRERRMPAVEAAIRADRTLSLRAMQTTSNVAGQVDLFYGQSALIVELLIAEYGEDQFRRLYEVFRGGSTTENALREVYGFGRDELEDQWRASVGLAPRERGEDRSTTVEDEVIAGPVIADAEDEGETEAVAEEAERSEESEESAGDESAGEDEAVAESLGDDESGEEEEAAWVDRRSEEERSERFQEIRARQSERRAGPAFTVDSGFAWEYPLIAVSAVLLVLTAGVSVRLLGRG